MCALGLQRAAVDHYARRSLASLADAERRDDDIGDAAIFLDRSLMANKRNGLAFDRADAAEAVAAEGGVAG